MDSLVDLNDVSKALDLSRIRYQLIRLEDTITFHLIERAQFALNKNIYIPGALAIPASNLSLLNWYLREQEKLQSLIRRYESPDEYPFFPDAVQKPILRPLNYPPILHPNDVVVNDKIRRFYVDIFLPAVCPDFGGRGDRGESQENYGSSATCDIACLQALSRRIHFGKFVAESKFRSDRPRFERLIRAADREGLAEAITNSAVEEKVLARLRLKVMTYGTDPSLGADGTPEGQPKIDADAVVAMYKDFVIPLTKEVEVEYLMQRLEPANPSSDQ
ncbi:chorismate mutase [Sodiomyces alkalinus F11]|uniref:Chorismate mutase n=1 Tax=Sodiomyces alkalinus (strain CBS 110278 / VKM F-3762 / F11) TaxID=1314773 RepID=A0A3N2Q1P9_SODAK|nr:chorismate mutase [Sodiomyces alkalinus F11]ROT40608.1 chorismate mutase [Sodiomyces alkalinus F11]